MASNKNESKEQSTKRKSTATNYRSVAIMSTIEPTPINRNTLPFNSRDVATLDYNDAMPMKYISDLRYQKKQIAETTLNIEENKKNKTYPEPVNITVVSTHKSTYEEEDKEFSEWKEPVDRFSNLVTSNSMSPNELKKFVENLMVDWKTNHDTYKDKVLGSNSCVLTYSFVKNCCYVHIDIDEFCRCDLTITIFTYEGGKCLLDIQELCGEHFTFSSFYECFKSALKNGNIVALPSLSQAFFDSYGLDMDISLDAF